jgi:hypothetical protein
MIGPRARQWMAFAEELEPRISSKARHTARFRLCFFPLLLLSTIVLGCGPDAPGTAPDPTFDLLDHAPVEVPATKAHKQGEMAGEVTQDSVILQARLNVDGKVRSGDVEGCPGVGAFLLFRLAPGHWLLG